MSQSKAQSLIETCMNTAIGFVGSYALGQFLYWSHGIHVTLGQNAMFTIYFTVWSVARGYFIRRWANQYLHSWSQRIVEKLHVE